MLFLLGLVYIIGAYLVGNLNFAYILVKIFKNEDVRDYGSGNAGTTNVLRIMGTSYALPVFVLDALKGSLIILLGRAIGLNDWFIVLGGIAVVAGHNWPVLLQFRGGKGTATSLGVFLIYDWKLALAAIIIGLVVLYFGRMVSLTSMVGLVSFFLLTIIMGQPIYEIIFAFILCFFSLFQHRKNIGRIIQKRESKIGQKISIDKSKKKKP